MALLTATNIPFEQPLTIGPYQVTTYKETDAFITYQPPHEWDYFYHELFSDASLKRLRPGARYEGQYMEFSLALSGQPDEGFDIYGYQENISVSVYANGQLIKQQMGPAGGGLGSPPFFSARCGGPGLKTWPKHYRIRLYRDTPPDLGNGRTLYIDFLTVYSRATSL